MGSAHSKLECRCEKRFFAKQCVIEPQQQASTQDERIIDWWSRRPNDWIDIGIGIEFKPISYPSSEIASWIASSIYLCFNVGDKSAIILEATVALYLLDIWFGRLILSGTDNGLPLVTWNTIRLAGVLELFYYQSCLDDSVQHRNTTREQEK